jgi:hypothetical protein
MAKELGMAPKSLLKNIPSPTRKWKLPVKYWVRELYEKKFGAARSERDPTYGGDSPLSAALPARLGGLPDGRGDLGREWQPDQPGEQCGDYY